MLSKTTTEEDYFILTHDTEHERRKIKNFFVGVVRKHLSNDFIYVKGDKLFEHIKDRQPNTARYVSKLHKRYLMSFRQKKSNTKKHFISQIELEKLDRYHLISLFFLPTFISSLSSSPFLGRK